ncbi:BTB domain and ankyrin repeat protein [Talaromyces proteolyticus]|uniref:BTB domain and ankyrin repeat protein n=1 Tax=Talaromyces proteolyticus TaxID=1131652 RepID=A0AAD4Q5V1_9EURO|nr:BTB domain and ankyrin repeat protein [Talaromyces proteolyticus]KAH8704953.1 BTB domain and ankyrin repeat protein [Talaromyces proteolyticus]
MSSTLLKYFLQDDVDSFKRLLANISNAPTGQRSAVGSITPKIESPKLGSSPNPSSRNKKTAGASPGASSFSDRNTTVRGQPTSWSRAQVNARDQQGRTILHLISSSTKPTAVDFANALLETPFVDIYAQDSESGWTALHRALYAGNAAVAQALIARDVPDFSALNNTQNPGKALIKIKDREGNSPFDVFGATIVGRDIKQIVSLDGKPFQKLTTAADGDSDVSSTNNSAYEGDDAEDGVYSRAVLKPRINLLADEVFTFGSNKNMTLGLGDEDDRQFPERISLERPRHLLQRFYREREGRLHNRESETDTSQDSPQSDLPTLVESKPIVFQDISMSKLHTAILTNDPESNLYMSGFGPGGRLGTGDEATRFHFVCIETGGLVGKKVISVALGQDHSIAISEQGEIFTWGSNKYGQLGYNLPRTSNKNDIPIQSTPRQIFNPFKREIILGAAASAIHSVVFSNSGLYTFGKNEGQLGLVDSDARSLEVQVTPRRVGVSLFSSPIRMVSAIDRATAVLLESSEVWVFTQYGYSKVAFPLDFSSYFIKESFLSTRYGDAVNKIVKITSGRNTICALSTFGEVYTVQVNNKSENTSTTSSTTNPAKIRNSLTTPERVWSVGKSHMVAADVDVGQDGSIIICTTSGSAWRKEKRIQIKESNSKDYKFVRIPGLSRVTAVRSNAFGAFAASQRDCDVTKEQVTISPSSLWHDLLELLPFKSLGGNLEDDMTATGSQVARIKAAIFFSSDIESEIRPIVQASSLSKSRGVVWVKSTLSDTRVPCHEFVLACRSSILRTALSEFRRTKSFSMPDFMTIELDRNGETQMTYRGVDFLSLLNLVLFIYTDDVLDIWRNVRHDSVNAYRYRQVRTEVMRIATHLEIKSLERAARVMVEPAQTLNLDIRTAFVDPRFFESSDVAIQLKDATVRAHSELLCQRCPFFDGLFHGRSSGRWLDSRRNEDIISVDLKDMDSHTFEFVLRYLYGDEEEEQLFADVRGVPLDDFIDLVLDVMFSANELMIDRLSEICQKMLGQFVNTRNVCHLLNAVAPCTVTEFKEAALEYICLNLETMLENRLLGDLEVDLMDELDSVCQENQLARYPVSRGRNSEQFMFEKYPELITLVQIDRQRRIDSMRLSSRRDQDELYDKIRIGGFDKATPSPSARKIKALQSNENKSLTSTPLLKARQSTGDLMFQMDDESATSPVPLRKGKMSMTTAIPDDLGEIPQATIPSLSLSHGESFGDPNSLDDRIGSIESGEVASFLESPSPLASKLHAGSPSPSTPRGVPWGSPVVSGNKRDLKGIMVETSQSRISNLTLGMSNRANNQSGSSFSQKMSQRERKKLQQIQAQETLAAQQRESDARQSPWQPVPKKPTQDLKDNLPEPTAQRAQVKITQRPSMTLRQTVSGAPSPRPTPSPGLSSIMSSSNKNEGRSFSQPALPPSSTATSAGGKPSPGPSKPKPTPINSSPSPAQPIIQSIRHTPRPGRSVSGGGLSSSNDQSASLASILLQQQAEKDEIHEAATAKHNLQDIQAEQEFQEWWDKESRRVMEEEARAAAIAAGREPSSSNNNKGRQRRKNRGGEQQQQSSKKAQTQTPRGDEKGRNHRRPKKTQNSV